jgi:hypothetical protein
MRVDDIFLGYVNKKREGHERQIGRYWASELGAICNGWLTPEHFFEEKEKPVDGAKMILTGIAMEDMLHKIFKEMKVDYNYQERQELKINDEIVITIKPDFVFKDFVIETKFPFSEITDTSKYAHQLEVEYRTFQKKVYLGVLSVPFDLRLMEYIPSKLRWDNIMKKVIKFHEELKKLHPK